jgi:secreted PhoX family phosphatase
MMLCADPSTGETKRFLTGPSGCEITGITFTPDRRAVFINIQHPGETASERSDPDRPQTVSRWPDGPAGGRPRSATVAIRRKDGGIVGT